MSLQRLAGNGAVAAMLAGRSEAGGPQAAVQRDTLDDIAGAATGVKSRIVHSLTDRAQQVPGYKLATVAVGKDLLTGEAVPQDAEHVVSAVASVIPGGEDKLDQLKQTGVIPKAAEFLKAELPKAGLTWDYASKTLDGLWASLEASDVLNPAGVWDRLLSILSGFISRVKAFATSAVPRLLELVFEGALALAGAGGEQVMAIIKKAGNVFTTIINDPIGFARNLMEALKGGVGQFATNVLGHLKNGLFGWLTGSLGGVIKLPEKWDLAGIVSMIAEFLGLTWSHVRTLLVQRLGEPVVAGIEKAVGWVKSLAARGIAAIADKVGDMAEGLMDTVIGGIKDWVARSVVGAAITKLISMLNPAGAVIQAIIAVYNTVQFFIERAQQIAAFASSVFDSVSAIASGALGDAKNAVENAMARSVPVLLGFLARLIGLGDIAAPVRNIMTTVRGVIDKAIDKALGLLIKLAGPAINAAKKLLAKGKAVVTGAIDKAKAGVGKVKDKLIGKKPEVAVHEEFELPGEHHVVSNKSGGIELMMASEHPISLTQHPSPAVRAAAANYFTKVDEAAAAVASGTKQVGHLEGVKNKHVTAVLTAIKTWGPLHQDGPGASAPGIGDVGPHGSQQSRLHKGGVPEWKMWSEHVISRGVIDVVVRALRYAGVPSNGSEYDGMTTVLTYYGARLHKNNSDGADLALLRSLATPIEGTASAKSRLTYLNLLWSGVASYRAKARGATTTAIEQEHRTVASPNTTTNGARRNEAAPTPSVGRVNDAFAQQSAEFDKLWATRFAEAEAQNAEQTPRPRSSLN